MQIYAHVTSLSGVATNMTARHLVPLDHNGGRETMANLPSRSDRHISVAPPEAAGPPPPVPTEQAVVDCAVYIDGRREPGKYTHSEALAEVRRRGNGFVWLGLHEPDEQQMTSVARTFGLHELMAEDAVHAHQRPKLERYDDLLFLVLRTVSYIEHESVTTTKDIVETGEIMLFTGPDFIISVRHGDHSELSRVRSRLEKIRDLQARRFSLAAIGTLSYNFSVTLPLFVTGSLHSSEGTFTVLYSIFSLGAVVASLVVVLINAVVGTVIAWVLVRDRFPGKAVLEVLIDIPFALPTIVAGLTLLAARTDVAPVSWLAVALLVVLLVVWGVVVVRTGIRVLRSGVLIRPGSA